MARPKRGRREQSIDPSEANIDSDEPVPSASKKRNKSLADQAKKRVGRPKSEKSRGKAKATAEALVPVDDDECADELDEEQQQMMAREEDEDSSAEKQAESISPAPNTRRRVFVPKRPSKLSLPEDDEVPQFVGDPIPSNEAKIKWPHRYTKKLVSNQESQQKMEKEENKAQSHYRHFKVDGVLYDIGDDVYIKAKEGAENYIGRIIELFKGVDGQSYFACRWFFRLEDTAIGKAHAHEHDRRRVFLSDEKDENILDCIVSKVKIVYIAPDINLEMKNQQTIDYDFYYNMSYSPTYSTFANVTPVSDESSSDIESLSPHDGPSASDDTLQSEPEASPPSCVSLLDLYSGCGAMSMGLCLGSQLFGVNLETHWAVDYNEYACKSLKLNHPHTMVRHEKAEDFRDLLIEWKTLCDKFISTHDQIAVDEDGDQSHLDGDGEDVEIPKDEYEVESIVGICFGDPQNTGEVGLKFKIHWRGFDESWDSWEPIGGLGNCEEKIRSFVVKGKKDKILPLPNSVEVICGGPPCQGISGFNRFRNSSNPLKDEKNKQMLVFMEIVQFLRPKYVLMENVVDILKFSDGLLGKYALSRLVNMNYQARLGIMAAGSYGLPQFRMRVFLWGALPTKVLPQYPLPTHNVVVRGAGPVEFEQNLVPFNNSGIKDLKQALTLKDALTDLPEVGNYENRDVMDYILAPQTEFQQIIRCKREGKLFDHRPLKLSENDYTRVCMIPKMKGANFRDLPGLKTCADKVVELDNTVPRAYLPDGKPLVPDYALTFIGGKSFKPFGRLWWDETVPTVVGRAEPHNQIILHPAQDRVLTIRENARLQGFPDYYRLIGPIKERYIQVGNAVAVPVARALGYAFAMAYKGITKGESALFKLPTSFPLLQNNEDNETVLG